ncbi:TonB-dependent receptor [Myroides phaeus]|uniref:TonB-dependent receptor n=1 Tax=Myroides phaeus TaxID=702745 RepID=UPI00130310C2|nr:TonB-dependent receptor [Myroides phaeus]
MIKQLVLLLLPLVMSAQVVEIRGIVVNEKKVPIHGVNVFLEGTYDGALSNQKGEFVFQTEKESIEGLLQFRHALYLDNSTVVNLSDDTKEIYVLFSKNNVLENIQIQVGGIKALGRDKVTAFTSLDAVTTAGSPGDIMAIMSTMPGAQVNSEDGRLMIRGGRAEETGIFVNGLRVRQPYTFSTGDFPVRSKYSPFLFKGMSFSTGAYSAEYGNALSGILELNTSDDIENNRTDLSLSSVGLSLAKSHQWNKNSLAVSLGYLDLRPYMSIIPQKFDMIRPYKGLSGEISFKRELKKGIYKLYASMDLSKTQFAKENNFNQDIDSIGFTGKNLYLNSHYSTKLNPFLKLEIGTGFGYTELKNNYRDLVHQENGWDLHQKVKLYYKWSNKIGFNVGIEGFLEQASNEDSNVNKTREFNTVNNTYAAFIENTWSLSSRFSLRSGIRTNWNNQVNEFVIEPRFAFAYQMTNNAQVSLAYGKFNQTNDLQYLRSISKPDWLKSTHYAINYTYNKNKQTFRAEVFYKKYANLMQYHGTLDNIKIANTGSGYAKGIDVFWKDDKSIKNVTYWISYSFLDSERREFYWDKQIQPSYVAKHNVSFVLKYWIDDWKSMVGITNTFTTGRRFYNPYELDYIQHKANDVNKLSLSWSYLLSSQKILFFSVENIFGQDPVYAYEFSSQYPSVQPVGITSAAKRFVFVGFFWTISSNKKINQLDNL